jgi:hypothetical protein
VFFGVINVLEWNIFFAILFTLPSLLFIFPKQILSFKMKGKTKHKTQSSAFNNDTNSSSYPQQSRNRFKSKSQTNEVIDGDYEIIKDNENNK